MGSPPGSLCPLLCGAPGSPCGGRCAFVGCVRSGCGSPRTGGSGSGFPCLGCRFRGCRCPPGLVGWRSLPWSRLPLRRWSGSRAVAGCRQRSARGSAPWSPRCWPLAGRSRSGARRAPMVSCAAQLPTRKCFQSPVPVGGPPLCLQRDPSPWFTRSRLAAPVPAWWFSLPRLAPKVCALPHPPPPAFVGWVPVPGRQPPLPPGWVCRWWFFPADFPRSRRGGSGVQQVPALGPVVSAWWSFRFLAFLVVAPPALGGFFACI